MDDDKTPAPAPAPAQSFSSSPSADAPTTPASPASTATPAEPAAEQAPAADARPPKPGRKRGLVIGGGIAAAVLLAGGGVAVGAAIGDEFGDDDDRPSMSDGARHDAADTRGGERDDDRGDDRRDDGAPSDGRGPVTEIGTDSADELVEIAQAARDAAEGEVTSIDARRDGTWEVQLTTDAGDETEVRVDAELATTVASTETADDDAAGPSLSLTDDAIRALVAAALDEVDGMVTDLDVDDDTSRPYDASVLTGDNRSIDIDFDSAFAVVGTDADD